MRLAPTVWSMLRVHSRPICAGGETWVRYRGIPRSTLEAGAIEIAKLHEAARAQCINPPWCEPEALSAPGALPERVRYFDVRRYVEPVVAGNRPGDLVPGVWAIELVRQPAPSYSSTVLERAQTFLRVRWDTEGELGAPLEVVGADPTPSTWIGTFDPYPLVHPTIPTRTIRARWVVVSIGEDGADQIVPLGAISPAAGSPAQTIPHAPRAVGEWADNARGMHRSIDREQHVVDNTPSILRFFVVIEATSEAALEPVRIASIKVGGRLAGVTVQSGPWRAGVRAATRRH